MKFLAAALIFSTSLLSYNAVRNALVVLLFQAIGVSDLMAAELPALEPNSPEDK
jgi:hypothetical protein